MNGFQRLFYIGSLHVPVRLPAVAVAGALVMLAGRDVAVSADADPGTDSACPVSVHKPVADTIVQVARVLDGRTISLADGRTLRLAGIEVPPMVDSGQDNVAARAGRAARDALASLVTGHRLVSAPAGTGKDRYQRLFAFAATLDHDNHSEPQKVQQALIADGHARVSGRVGSIACAKALLRLEHKARTAKLGLWRDPYYELRQADRPGDVLSDLGHFSIVEGRVVSVRESGATIYVNFGRRWIEDFTVTILKRNARTLKKAGLDPKDLANHRIRVRGWVEARGGPLIEVFYPEQIEVIGAGATEPVD